MACGTDRQCHEVVHGELFGKDLVPKFCFSTARLTTGLQYTEGQEVTINAHNQVANFTVAYTEDEKVMGFSRHINGICWKILAMLWCDKKKTNGQCR